MLLFLAAVVAIVAVLFYFTQSKASHNLVTPKIGRAAVHKMQWVDRQDFPTFNMFQAKKPVVTARFERECDAKEIFVRKDLLVWSFDAAKKIVVLCQVDFDSLKKKPFLDRGVRHVMKEGDDIVVLSFADVKEFYDSNPRDWSKVNFVWNTGRCGSTLMHRVLEKVDRMASFSEPQYMDDALMTQRKEQEEYHKMIYMFMHLDMHLTSNRRPEVTHFSFNPKGSIRYMQYYMTEERFAKAKHIFMYREKSKVINSFLSIFCQELPWFVKIGLSLTGKSFASPQQPHTKEVKEFMPKVLGRYPATSPPTHGWLLRSLDEAAYWHAAVQAGAVPPKMPVIHMAQFVDKQLRRKIVDCVFQYWGLALTAPELDAACSAFETNSQKGSHMTKAQGTQGKKFQFFTKDEIELVESLLMEFPLYQCPLPNSWGVDVDPTPLK